MKIWKRSSVPWVLKYGGNKINMLNRPLLPAFICFAGGILAGRFITFYDHFSVYLALLLIFLVFSLLFSSDNIKVLVLSAIFLFSGMFLITCKVEPVDLLKIAENRKVILEGTVISPPKINDKIKNQQRLTEIITLIKPKEYNLNIHKSQHSNRLLNHIFFNFN